MFEGLETTESDIETGEYATIPLSSLFKDKLFIKELISNMDKQGYVYYRLSIKHEAPLDVRCYISLENMTIKIPVKYVNSIIEVISEYS
tara:strand:- start:1213 stop:1479 length:267 start_codon:yes stop_codon:yes gene_type:complete